MKKLTIGILAHVDAGKTTLSESMLYISGTIDKPGRVDNKDAYLDTYDLEKARGITIFSKQAILEMADTKFTLLDTPGHVDFSAEMERTLQVLDYGILVISGADGVQGHTKTLWRLFNRYHIPVFIFVNKMDQLGTDKEDLLSELKKQLDEGCVEFSGNKADDFFYEQLALCEEELLEAYVRTGQIRLAQIQHAIKDRKVFPCFFGSALRLYGIREFMEDLVTYTLTPTYSEEFGAKIFKITRDDQGNRLTHMKLTGGNLKVKDSLTNGVWEEKINQIRVYSGQKFEVMNQIDAGTVCAVTGLTKACTGEGLGIEEAVVSPLLEPVLVYRVSFLDGHDPRVMLPKLRQIEEEEPELHVVWNDKLQEIHLQVMGEVQIEILQSMIQSRFNVKAVFDEGDIVYKETIGNVVEGVGHFEPLRHYAEVHLLMEPGEPGSGLLFGTICSEEQLSKNWQKLILTHLKEKEHIGVLTGSAITDMKITLVAGRAHNKHTEGGDFREATYRALRQGLKEAESLLLEPYYAFQLELPEKMVGRAMHDIEKMYGTSEITRTDGEMVLLTGKAPMITMRNYQAELASYTKGLGRLFCTLSGYEPCHNADEIIMRIGYDSQRDIENPTGSVFCTHGAGFLVEWHEVKKHMHVEGYVKEQEKPSIETNQKQLPYTGERQISQEEIEQIFNQTYYANTGKKTDWKKNKVSPERYYESTSHTSSPKEMKEEYLLIDGYNIIYAWPELQEIAEETMEGARMKLLEIVSNYQSIRLCHLIVVFDAYQVKGHREEVVSYYNIHIVYTKEAQTADQYIEKFVHDNIKKYRIIVATSDGMEQLIIRGAGSMLLSARELKIEIEEANERIQQKFTQMQEGDIKDRNYLNHAIPVEVIEQIKNKN